MRMEEQCDQERIPAEQDRRRGRLSREDTSQVPPVPLGIPDVGCRQRAHKDGRRGDPATAPDQRHERQEPDQELRRQHAAKGDLRGDMAALRATRRGPTTERRASETAAHARTTSGTSPVRIAINSAKAPSSTTALRTPSVVRSTSNGMTGIGMPERSSWYVRTCIPAMTLAPSDSPWRP